MHSIEDTAAFSRQVQRMFTAIAPRYDFLNRLLSVGQDRSWRKRAINRLALEPGERILDIATGTGDMALEIASRNLSVQISGIDFSRRMLDLGRKKIKENGYDHDVSFQIGSAECLPFADDSFHGAVCAFGIRNFADVKLGLREFHRILKPGGRAVILEFSKPTNRVLKSVYNWYFDLVLPKVGSLISGHNDAYSYLPESVADFPDQAEFVSWIKEAGFQKVSFKELTFGIVSIHHGYKGI